MGPECPDSSHRFSLELTVADGAAGATEANNAGSFEPALAITQREPDSYARKQWCLLFTHRGLKQTVEFYNPRVMRGPGTRSHRAAMHCNRAKNQSNGFNQRVRSVASSVAQAKKVLLSDLGRRGSSPETRTADFQSVEIQGTVRL